MPRFWKASEEERKVEGIPFELIEDLDAGKLINYTLIKALGKCMEDWKSIPYAVNVLESVCWNLLPEDYEERVKKLTEEANKLFPMWQRNEEQKTNYIMYIWNGKLRIIVQEILKKGKHYYTDLIPWKIKKEVEKELKEKEEKQKQQQI
jgi:hypothetical protein